MDSFDPTGCETSNNHTRYLIQPLRYIYFWPATETMSRANPGTTGTHDYVGDVYNPSRGPWAIIIILTARTLLFESQNVLEVFSLLMYAECYCVDDYYYGLPSCDQTSSQWIHATSELAVCLAACVSRLWKHCEDCDPNWDASYWTCVLRIISDYGTCSATVRQVTDYPKRVQLGTCETYHPEWGASNNSYSILSHISALS